MKKSLLLMVLTVVLMGTMGCSKKESETGNVADKEPVQEKEISNVADEDQIKKEETGNVTDKENEEMQDVETVEELKVGDYTGKKILDNGYVMNLDDTVKDNMSLKVEVFKDDKKIWEYETGEYTVTELNPIEIAGETTENILLNEGGTIVALNKETGEVSWKNTDFKGRGIDAIIDSKENLYICGWYVPDLCIIDKDGNTINYVERFAENWEFGFPEILECREDEKLLYMTFEEENGKTDRTKIAVCLDDMSYTKVE